MNNHVLYQNTCSFQLRAYAAIYNISKLQLEASNAIVTGLKKNNLAFEVNRLCFVAGLPVLGKA